MLPYYPKTIEVTEDNMAMIAEDLPCDQAAELEPGCIVANIYCGNNQHKETITFWPRTCRAAIYRGGDSEWIDANSIDKAAEYNATVDAK